MCSKLHCQESFTLKHISHKIRAPAVLLGWSPWAGANPEDGGERGGKREREDCGGARLLWSKKAMRTGVVCVCERERETGREKGTFSMNASGPQPVLPPAIRVGANRLVQSPWIAPRVAGFQRARVQIKSPNPQKALRGGISRSFLEPLGRFWNHLVGIYRQN